jgi:penicillin amidase
MKNCKNPLSAKSKLILPAVITAAGLAGVGFAWRHLLKRSLPAKNSRFTLNGLSKPVEIIRDRWGVPHIYAQNDQDLFFAQGFVHAQDRLFQMDTFRRVGSGRVSELIGSSGLATDRFARYFGWNKVAEAQMRSLDAETQKLLDVYSAGVNAYIRQGNLPVEFSLLAYTPDPWRFWDTAVWGAVLAWGLSVNWETELVRVLLLEALGPEKAFDLTSLYDDDYQTIIPDEQVGQRLAQALMESYQQAILTMPLGNIPSGKGIGSNNWAVNGELTASGRPILANDPHLPPLFPPFWYENHLVGESYNVTGFTMPGVPGVIIGHNEHVAWGVTNAFPDVQDIYIERFHVQDPSLYEVNGCWQQADLVEEVIKVRGGKAVAETVRYTRHGPVFSDLLPQQLGDLSLRWASHSPNSHMCTILDMNRATNWGEFRESLRSWGFPSQNVVYADVNDNIGYMMPGLVPQRGKGAGLLPVPGWNDDHEWDGWIPFEELPVISNPPEGMIVTANNRVHGATYPHLLTSEWLPDYRARRIWELLANNVPLTLEMNGRIQADTVSLQMRRFKRLALAGLSAGQYRDRDSAYAVRQLRNWDGDMRPELVEPSLSFGWLVCFTRAVVEQATGPVLAVQLMQKNPPESFPLDPFLDIATELALNWLEHGSPAWVGDIKPLLWPALQETLQILRHELGRSPYNWQWGKLHQVDMRHPFAKVPGLGRAWKRVKLPVGGDGYTVNQSEVGLLFPPDPVTVIASCRLIMDVGDWDNSLAVLPGGQSGHLASPHFQDGLADWQNDRYHPMLFTRERIEKVVEGITLLEPVTGFGSNRTSNLAGT